MSTIISVTKQWQIYIPEEVRQALAWTKPEKAKVELRGKTMVVRPERSKLMDLAGKYKEVKRRKGISLDRIRNDIDYSQL